MAGMTQHMTAIGPAQAFLWVGAQYDHPAGTEVIAWVIDHGYELPPEPKRVESWLAYGWRLFSVRQSRRNATDLLFLVRG